MMGLNHWLEPGPDLQDMLIDLRDWLDLGTDWVGPPDNFRARGFVEGMIKLNEEGKELSIAQEEAIIKIYKAFDVANSMDVVRGYEHAMSKD